MPEFVFPIIRDNLRDYGVKQGTVDDIFKDVADWIESDDLPWNRSHYVVVMSSARDKVEIELMFFHFDGITAREIGSGGELNNCILHLYEDRVSINFTANNSKRGCCLALKYVTEWYTTDHRILRIISKYLNRRVSELLDLTPEKSDGTNYEVEVLKLIAGIADNTIISRYTKTK